jgi:predicted signal transduction protein with EAL and GGDEF domain
VTDVERSSESKAVVDAVMGLGKALNLKIVAEGIETEIDRAYMEQAGCRYAQGYLKGRPEPAHRLYHLMRARQEPSDGLLEAPAAAIGKRQAAPAVGDRDEAQAAKPDLKLIATDSRRRA